MPRSLPPAIRLFRAAFAVALATFALVLAACSSPANPANPPGSYSAPRATGGGGGCH